MAARKTRFRRRPARKTKKVAKVSRPLKQAINKIVRGTQELKYVGRSLRNYSNSSLLSNFNQFSSAITGTGETYSLIPYIVQGDNGHSREGNVVYPKKLRVHLNICASQTQTANIDYMVYAFFLECPQVRDFANSSAFPITSLMDDGSGTMTTFDGTSATALYTINKKVFKVLRVIKKRMIWNYPSALSSTTQDPSQNHHSISLDIPIPVKKYTYADDNTFYPNNHAPFFCLGFIDNTKDGDTAPGGLTGKVSVQGRSELWFTDS